MCCAKDKEMTIQMLEDIQFEIVWDEIAIFPYLLIHSFPLTYLHLFIGSE